MRGINSDHVDDVRFHYSQLFCISRNPEKGQVEIQVYDTRTWERICVIKSPCGCSHKYRHTLHVGSEYITIACVNTNSIYTVTHQGDHVNNTKPGEFVYPYMCHNVSDAILVADFSNHRLQLQHAGEWSHVQLDHLPLWPRDAVYAGGALFVLSSYVAANQRIIKYIPA